MSGRERVLTPYCEETVERIAKIMGPHSAAASALKDMESRRKAGERVMIYRSRQDWFVGPDYRAALSGEE